MTTSDIDICEFEPPKFYCFPFGQAITAVEQRDRRPKKVFVLGVYSSAVHARWIGPDGKTRIRALAVANEPSIFWRGDRAEAELAISNIVVPPGAGRLEPADEQFNGPSGRALDDQFLAPLGFRREDAWLCDLLPVSCCNPSQAKAIARAYEPVRETWGLPEVVSGRVPRDLCPPFRRHDILREIYGSQAEVLVVLGDVPIRQFLLHVSNMPKMSLAAYGATPQTYGRSYKAKVGDRSLEVIPLVHPRQAAALGKANAKWTALHKGWVAER